MVPTAVSNYLRLRSPPFSLVGTSRDCFQSISPAAQNAPSGLHTDLVVAPHCYVKHQYVDIPACRRQRKGKVPTLGVAERLPLYHPTELKFVKQQHSPENQIMFGRTEIES